MIPSCTTPGHRGLLLTSHATLLNNWHCNNSSPFVLSLSLRMKVGKVIWKSSASSHMASPVDCTFHWAKTSVKHWPCLRISLFFNIALGSLSGCWLRNLSGRFRKQVFRSPTNRFSLDTWKPLWILIVAGNSRWYVTSRIMKEANSWYNPSTLSAILSPKSARVAAVPVVLDYLV